MKPIIVLLASVLAFSPNLYAATASRNAEAANVIRVDEGCTIGWIGCPLADGVQLPDGSYDCPLAAIRLVPITGDRTSVEANNAGGRVVWHCQTQIAFGQLNPLGVDGSLGQIVAARPETVCLFFPAACRAEGAVIANETTVGGELENTQFNNQHIINHKWRTNEEALYNASCTLNTFKCRQQYNICSRRDKCSTDMVCDET